MPDPWSSENIQGRNLCPSCKSSSSIEDGGETVDVTIDADGKAIVYEEDVGDVVVCRVCEEEFEVKDEKSQKAD